PQAPWSALSTDLRHDPKAGADRGAPRDRRGPDGGAWSELRRGPAPAHGSSLRPRAPGAHRLAGAAGGDARPAEHRADPSVVRRLPDHTTSQPAHAPLTLKKQAPASRAGGGPPGGCAATEPTTSVVSDSGRTASGSRWGLRRR